MPEAKGFLFLPESLLQHRQFLLLKSLLHESSKGKLPLEVEFLRKHDFLVVAVNQAVIVSRYQIGGFPQKRGFFIGTLDIKFRDILPEINCRLVPLNVDQTVGVNENASPNLSPKMSLDPHTRDAHEHEKGGQDHDPGEE